MVLRGAMVFQNTIAPFQHKCNRKPCTAPCGRKEEILHFAQNHPIYSGGSTGLTDFFGVIVGPSISQRNCWRVNERTSSGLRGYWKRLSESLLYNRSHPSPSHTSF